MWDANLYEGSAPYYTRGRVPYPPELGETLRHRWRADDVPMRDRRPLLLRALQELYP